MMRRHYAIAALALLAVEIAIAVFQKGGFVRHTLGDALAVMLVYCALRTLWRPKILTSAHCAFLIACMIEGAQAAGLLGLLKIDVASPAGVVIGATFDWGDIAAYFAGAAIAFGVDGVRLR